MTALTIGSIRELKDLSNLQPPQHTAPVQPSFGDSVHTLPLDGNPITDTDRKILTTFFSSPKTREFIADYKEPVLGGLIFIALSLPYVDELVGKFLADKTQSVYAVIAVKGLAFSLLFYIAKSYMNKKPT